MADSAPRAAIDLSAFDDAELLQLRARLHGELKRRGLSLSVGQVAEKLAFQYFGATAGCSNLIEAAVGTANVDALSRRGDRYSIKGVLDARKTGTVYPDPQDTQRQLFEYLLVVQLSRTGRFKQFTSSTGRHSSDAAAGISG